MKSRCTLLTREQETELALLLKSPATPPASRQRARDQLFESCWPYVLRLAKKFRARKCSQAELAQAGAVGLLVAIDKFDPTRGFRLCTYAVSWITMSMTRHVSASIGAVRRDTSPELIKAQSLLRKGAVSSAEELAAMANLRQESANFVWWAVEKGDVSLVNASGEHIDVRDHGDLPDTLAHESRVRADVRRAVACLPPSQRNAVEGFYFEDRPLLELTHERGTSRQAVHQARVAGEMALACRLSPTG